MTKTLYLLRHAQAESALNCDDKDRPLSAQGIQQAEKVGLYLKEKAIDSVICSSAKRTRMTLKAVQENGEEFENIEYSDAAYNAPVGELLNIIQASSADNILLIAHNPGIHMLANIFINDDENANTEKLKIFYRPATLSIIECDIDHWKDIQPHENKLIDLVIPE